MNLDEKLDILCQFASGMPSFDDIHNKGLTHLNFHGGNIIK